MTQQDIILEARKLVGVPFRHQGRSLFGGIDCIGAVIAVADVFGINYEDQQGYSRFPDGVSLENALDKHFIRRRHVDDMQPSDVLLFAIGRHPCHVGIFTGVSIIHAHISIGKVIETIFEPGMQPNWWSRRVVAYAWPGVTC